MKEQKKKTHLRPYQRCESPVQCVCSNGINVRAKNPRANFFQLNAYTRGEQPSRAARWPAVDCNAARAGQVRETTTTSRNVHHTNSSAPDQRLSLVRSFVSATPRAERKTLGQNAGAFSGVKRRRARPHKVHHGGGPECILHISLKRCGEAAVFGVAT